MTSKTLVFVLAASAFYLSNAICPNSCSGHGTCGDNDQCTCYTNFLGGDCSLRVCPYYKAWAAAPQGDLNFDGDLYDGTQYSDSHAFTASAAYLSTDAAPGGTWEYWPSFHSQSTDEGHFYMECANRGICNRETGLCQCFEGYEGEACRRRTCPNSCSGHGTCLTVNQLTADEGTYTYALWDGDMSRTCKCDAGYTGTDCSERMCPYGDDPLTTTHQIDEIQWIDIYATSATGPLGGSAKFTFTDAHGAAWETDPVDVMTYDATTAAVNMGADLKAALEALPNDVISGVTVTAGFCEKVLPGKFQEYDAATASADQYNGGVNPSGYLRCPANTINALNANYLVVDPATTFVEINGFAGAGSVYDPTAVGVTPGNTGVSDVTCNSITYPHCVRFKVEFTANPGDHAAITVDTSGVSMNGKTMAQDNTVGVASSVTDSLVLVDDSTATFGYKLTSGQTITATDLTGTLVAGGTTVNVGGAPDNGAIVFPAGAKIKVKCTQGGTLYDLGTYTVVSMSLPNIVVAEPLVNDNGYCALSGDGYVKTELVSHYLDTNVDLTSESLVGIVPYVDLFSAAPQEAKTTIDSITYPAAGAGVIFLSETSSLTAAVTSATATLTLKGTGTKELSECGDRGLCDRDTGDCKCFKGYTGAACGSQNSLVV